MIGGKERVCWKHCANRIVYLRQEMITILLNALLFINVDNWEILVYTTNENKNVAPISRRNQVSPMERNIHIICRIDNIGSGIGCVFVYNKKGK